MFHYVSDALLTAPLAKAVYKAQRKKNTIPCARYIANHWQAFLYWPNSLEEPLICKNANPSPPAAAILLRTI